MERENSRKARTRFLIKVTSTYKIAKRPTQMMKTTKNPAKTKPLRSRGLQTEHRGEMLSWRHREPANHHTDGGVLTENSSLLPSERSGKLDRSKSLLNFNLSDL